MLGALIGDIVGSRFEFTKFKGKKFEFFEEHCHPTDDSLMTLAIAKALVVCKDWSDEDSLKQITMQVMKDVAKPYEKSVGWGASFYRWLFVAGRCVPYESYGNGAGMRISPVGWVADSEEEVKYLSRVLTEISHNHLEGIKGAEAIAMAVYLARIGKSKEEIKERMIKDYYPQIKYMTVENIRPNYGIDDQGDWVTCQGSVPHSLVAFFDSTDFEDAVRNGISLGGDADTIGCMAGAVAEAYYGVSYEMEDKALGYLSAELKSIYFAFDMIRKKRVKREG